MRFNSEGPSIPDMLLEHRDAGRVVFLCGAGVSIGSGMPNFIDLTEHVIKYFDPPEDSEIMKAFRPWKEDQSTTINKSFINVPLDQIFNLLHHEYGKDRVNAQVTKRLSCNTTPEVGREHGLIKRISSNQSGDPQIVTTNFDKLFENGLSGKKLKINKPPNFLDLNFGSTIEGITYLHGRIVDPTSGYHPYVLSSADFGRAYLSEGWATKFIQNLLEKYTVVMIGYQAEDPPIKYLLQGLNHDGQYDRSRLYTFDKGNSEEIEVKWRDRGITAIAFPEYRDLWSTLEAWADRADNPKLWRKSIITLSQEDPKVLTPHERGQVAHVLRTSLGTKMFAEADPIPHPEWICVMDANVRLAEYSSSFDQAEIFDPIAAYGLDDDLIDIAENDFSCGLRNDNLLFWRVTDDNPPESHHLVGLIVEGFETIPSRLEHLITWIRKSINSPVLAWWAIRQNGIHRQLLKQIEWNIVHLDDPEGFAQKVWNLILEYHRDYRNQLGDGDRFAMLRRITPEGWTASVLKEFRQVTTPRIDIKQPYGLGKSKPPSLPWEEIKLAELGEFEVKFPEQHKLALDVPDGEALNVLCILKNQLNIASGILSDLESNHFPTPNLYPHREVNGEDHVLIEAEVILSFIKLFDRVVELWPALANAHTSTWPATDRYFFRKLKLYAFNKKAVFEADHVSKEVLAFDQESFWDENVARELLFLLVDRWEEFSKENQVRLAVRIFKGPDRLPEETEEEFIYYRDLNAARYARYLELQGCNFPGEFKNRLVELIENFPEWKDDWVTSLTTVHGLKVSLSRPEVATDVFNDIPLDEIALKAMEELELEFPSFIQKNPFKGLVKDDPRKALSALTIAGKSGNYPPELWSELIKELPEDINPRLRREYLNQITILPQATIVELRFPLAEWLKQNLVSALEFDDDLGWRVYDHIVDGILSDEPEATVSGLGDVQYGCEVKKLSRRTYGHAISRPVGMLTKALFRTIPNEKQEIDLHLPDHIKTRFERLLEPPSEGSDHAVSIVLSQLNWLFSIDTDWTKERIIPMLDFNHPASEPAWNGFLRMAEPPSSHLAEIVKPLMLQLFPRIEKFQWNQHRSMIAASWLGNMRVFYPDKLGGLTSSEMKFILRRMSDYQRIHFIYWLRNVGQEKEKQEKENRWVKYVMPFIKKDWPKELRYKTSGTIKAWIELLVITDDSFPDIFETVKEFLDCVEMIDHLLYRFTKDNNNLKKNLTVRFPVTTLDLMDRISPKVLTRPTYELKILELIAEAHPALKSDYRYIRLIDLVERS